MNRFYGRSLCFTLLAILLLPWQEISAEGLTGDLGPNQVFQSKRLGYDLHYRVYTPANFDSSDALPTLYVTDGQSYIRNGRLHELMDRLIADGSIEPAVVVFIDNRDPYNYNVNRRNSQFFCNQDYIHFVAKELAPFIDSKFGTSTDRADRTILGLSFGGLNSACFGLYAHDSFRGIAMQSPAMHPVPDIFDSYASLEDADLKVFLSTGTNRDNEARTRAFKKILDDVGLEMHYVEVPYGHTWQNWQPLLDDILLYYYGTTEES